MPKAGNGTGRSGKQQRRKRVSEGIYQDQYGLAATVKVGGKQQEVRFPPGTSLRTIQAERTRMKAAMQAEPSRRSTQRQTLAHDAERYLELVAPLVAIRNRRTEIGVWVPAFGHLRTLSLPNHVNALNAQLRKWRAERAASTVNKWRNALTNLVKVLYGKRAAAELIDLERFRPAPPEPRWIEREHVLDVLNHLTPGTKTAARLFLLHWTGTRPRQLMQLSRDDFRLNEPIPYVAIPRGRKGGKLVPLPLTSEGTAAAEAFIEADAFGDWSCSSANKALRRAAERAGRPRFTVYQIRHTFAAALRRSGTDLADIKDMLGHMNVEITEIYAPASIEKHQNAVQRMVDAEQSRPTSPPTPRGGSGLRLVHGNKHGK